MDLDTIVAARVLFSLPKTITKKSLPKQCNSCLQLPCRSVLPATANEKSIFSQIVIREPNTA